MGTKRWIIKEENSPINVADVELLINELKISTSLATLLVQRGINTFHSAKTFFTFNLEYLHDPYLMKDMDKAVERLHEAINTNEKVLVYGDYDVDGTTSVAMFYDFLKSIHPLVEYYIPDRNKEGYGVSTAGIEWAEQNDIKLIVTLDCGIKSADKISAAKEKGIDFIVCDHHRPSEDLPNAVAVLDPKRSDCPYPYKELTGCGVGFKLIQAYTQSVNGDMASIYKYLDFVMISTASDIVPITGENRVLCHHGLKILNGDTRCGLEALINVAKLSKPLTITNVVFGLAPRINAAGRIKHAKEAVNLMLQTEFEEAKKFADEIDEHNSDRRNFDATITEEAIKMIEEDEWLRNANSTVLYNSDWHKGVIGIVASRCIEQYHRPTIIMTRSNGKAAGSARSVPGFDVYDAIELCSEHLEQFGGHTFAAGLTLPIENIPAFRKKFEEVVSSKIAAEQLIPRIEADSVLELNDINDKFYRILQRMEPFGPENMTPTFVSHNLKLTQPPSVLKEKHIKLQVKQGNSPSFNAIGFGLSNFYEELKAGNPFSLCYTIEENHFRGERSLQLFIKDIKVTN